MDLKGTKRTDITSDPHWNGSSVEATLRGSDQERWGRGELSKPTLSIRLCEGNSKLRMETKGEPKCKLRTWFCSGKRLKHIYMLRGCAGKQVD